MKVDKKVILFLAGIFTLTMICLMKMKGTGADRKGAGATGTGNNKFNINPIPLPQANTTPDVNVLPTIPPMPSASCAMSTNDIIANGPDLDRTPLDDESISLLPANEMIQLNYKDWPATGGTSTDNVDKELYASDKPMFNRTGKVDLVPLDVNGTNRRVNFY
jgi:hypothetical protein